MSESTEPRESNVCSPRYFIARRLGACGYCHSPTNIIALAVPPGHWALEMDAEAHDDAASVDSWRLATHSAFLFYVEYLPDIIHHRLKRLARYYRFGHSDAAMGFYWANHCERCGCVLDDHDLFCEPAGAFVPTSESAARLIHLLPVDEEIEVRAAGYAYEPQFFDAMSRG